MINDEQRITIPGSPFGVVRGIVYGYAGTDADVFLPQMRELGTGLVRLFLWWGQIEPEPDHFVWDAVDTLLDQLQPSDEVWIMLGSSSFWATRRSTDLLPASPCIASRKASSVGFLSPFLSWHVCPCSEATRVLMPSRQTTAQAVSS